MLKNLSLLFLLFTATFSWAGEPHGEADNHGHAAESKSESYDPVPVIMHHIADAHEWHFWGEGENSVSIPLPVILWTDNGLVMFSSSKFHHDDEGKVVAEAGDQKFVRVHGKIYEASVSADSHGSYVEHGEDGHAVMNVKPLDFSITKNVAGIFLAMIILLLIFTRVAKSYKTNGGVPRKLTGWMEPLVVFVRDDIAIPNIGEGKYKKFLPFLLTTFFFIWVLNLLGLVPGGANVTGNIAVTFVLAVFTMILVAINGNKNYWTHIFWPPVPLALKPLMIPIEFIGILTKPFALMIRLFANMAAGHIVILSLVSLIFVAAAAMGNTGGFVMSIPSMALVLFISVLELLVAVLQAYIFTLLTALFIGMAVEEHH